MNLTPRPPPCSLARRRAQRGADATAGAAAGPDRRCRRCRRRGRDGRARLGRGRRRLRHRRRLRRSPGFAMAILGRVLEAAGFRVAILSQPDWQERRALAAVRPAAAVLRRQRRQHGLHDQPLHGQQEGPQRRRLQPRRPDRPAARPGHAALLPAGPRGVPRRAGDRRRRRGVAAAAGPLRLLERHRPAVDPARLQGRPRRLRHGRAADRRDRPPARRRRDGPRPARHAGRRLRARRQGRRRPADALVLALVRGGQGRQAARSPRRRRIIHQDTNPHNARRLVQYHDRQAVVANPPGLPVSQDGDGPRLRPAVHAPAAPDVRRADPRLRDIKDSVTIMRGCFGGCTFCSITAHQGRIIQSRSQESVLGEVRQMAADPEFKGVVTDIGGPTANMYQMRCTRPEVEAKCRRLSCVHPTICKLLGTDHGPLVELMQESREEPGVDKVLVASGIRMDLAQQSPEYMRRAGRAPRRRPAEGRPRAHRPRRARADEEAGDRRLRVVRPRRSSEASASRRARKQYLVPYFIASHPGSDLDAMIDLALFLKRNGYRPDQVQDFIPARSTSPRACTTRASTRSRRRGLRRQGHARPEDAAGADAVLQAGELFRGAGGADQGGPAGPDRRGLRLPDPGQPPKAAIEARTAAGERVAGRGKYVHQIDTQPKPSAAAIGRAGSRHGVGKESEKAAGRRGDH